MSTHKTTPTRQRRRSKRKFFRVSYRFRGGPPGLVLLNLDALVKRDNVLGPPIGRRGFPDYREPPRFLFDRKFGIRPRDYELFHYYSLVSDRAKLVFQTIDPHAFAFVRCEVMGQLNNVLRQGLYDGPECWLCDVTRVLDALDETRSDVRIRRGEPGDSDGGEKYYDAWKGLVFKEDVVGDCHVFRMAHQEMTIICDDVLKDACNEAGLTHMKFYDASKH